MVESFHEITAVAVDIDGRILGSAGTTDRPFFIRSAAKPFQAMVAEGLGGVMPLEWLAVACSSHDGDSVHLAIVEEILASVGLTASDLGTPPGRVLGSAARRRDAGLSPLRHNCSGKHAAMLRACAVQGWDLEGYLDPGHPLQTSIALEMVGRLSSSALPVGVDGCGAPVFRCDAESLATGFAALLDPLYARVLTAMMRYPTLVSGVGTTDAVLANALGGAAKRGAEGCLGAVFPGRGAIGVKVWDGNEARALPVALLQTLGDLGWMSESSSALLEETWARPVLGRGRPVGRVRADFELESA